MSNISNQTPQKPVVDPKTGQYSYKPPKSTATYVSSSGKAAGNGSPIPTSPYGSQKPPKKTFPKWLLLLIGAVLFLNVGLPLIDGIFIELQGRADRVEAPSDEEMQELKTADNYISQIENTYSFNGSVSQENMEVCVNEVANYASLLVEQGVLTDYSNDSSSVWMIDQYGLQTIFVPSSEDTLSLNTNEYYSIVTVEPHEGTFSENAELWSDKNAEAAVRLDGVSDLWTYTSDVDTYSVTPEAVRNFGENQIILWFGHGVWSASTGSALVTGEYFDANRYATDSDYRAKFTGGYYARTAGEASRVIITAKYIADNLGSVKNSVVFLGSCCSTKGVELVSAFLQKGALAVVGNSEVVKVYYYTHMLESMVQTLCSKDESGQYHTFGTALNVARQKYGYNDSMYGGKYSARVELYGIDVENLRITDTWAAEPTEPEQIPQAQPVHQLLADYASRFSYLNGTVGYTGFYTKTKYRHVYSYSLPDQPIVYTIADFDQDHVEELLIADSNSDNTVKLRMYEVFGGAVVQSAETDLPVPIAGSAEDGTTEYFYFYRNGRLQICVSELSIANRVASGTILRCAGAIYDGHSFTLQGFAEIVGTAGADDPFVKDMAAMGIGNVNLYDMLSGYKLATDYLSNCTVFCTARAMCTITDGEWMTYQDAWFGNDSLTHMDISYIGFKKSLLSS